MDMLQEVKRMIVFLTAPIRMLPFDNDFKKGQLDMADSITRLIEVMQNSEGLKMAESLEMKSKEEL